MYECCKITHAYRDFVAHNDCAIFIKISGLFKRQRLKNLFLMLHMLRNRWFTNNFKTDKKTFFVTKCLHIATVRLSKDQRNQVIGVLKAKSTVNDLARHFGCSRQTIHNLMNWYNRTGSFRV